jgi:hypothetical protein
MQPNFVRPCVHGLGSNLFCAQQKDLPQISQIDADFSDGRGSIQCDAVLVVCLIPDYAIASLRDLLFSCFPKRFSVTTRNLRKSAQSVATSLRHRLAGAADGFGEVS